MINTFTAHNILLPGDRQTLPGAELTADTGICQAALRDLDLAFPPQRRAAHRPTVADLGCLEGGYAAAFAKAGYDVTGYEVRPDNYRCCEEVAQALDLPNLRFEQRDVRQLATVYDAIFCCGLLYHLDCPVAFLKQLGRLTRRMLIVQTHYSGDGKEEHEGYEGGWFTEGGGRWSSWGNDRAFWLRKEELMDAMREAGFSLVFEQADYRQDIRSGIYLDAFDTPEVSRSMFVGVKS